jgi:hypothetical protein
VPLLHLLGKWRWCFTPCGSQEQRSTQHSALSRHKSKGELTVFEYSLLVESRCPCRDVGEAIPVGSLRPIWTAHETVGGRTLERPSCGDFMPTAETTLFPAYSVRSRRLLTSSAQLDNSIKSGRRNRTDTPNLSSETDNGWIPLFRGGTFSKETTEKSKTNFGDGARGGGHTDETTQ